MTKGKSICRCVLAQVLDLLTVVAVLCWLQDAESSQQLLSLQQHGSLPELDDAGGTLRRMFATQQRSRACSLQSQRHNVRPQPEQGATLRRLCQTQQLPAAQHNTQPAADTQDATLRRLFHTQQLASAQQHLPPPAEESQGGTMRRLFQTQQLPAAQQHARPAEEPEGGTMRRLFQTQQLPAAQQHSPPPAEESQGGTMRRLFQTQQLPAAQQHAPLPAEEPEGGTMRRLFQTQQLPTSHPAGSDPLQPQSSLQPSRGPSLQKLSRQRSFRPEAALPAEVDGASKQVLHATVEALSDDQVGWSAA